MGRKRSKITKKQIKYMILGGAALAVVAAGILLAVFLPTIIARSELNDIFRDLGKVESPVMIITDMKSDSTFSDARGEIKIDDESSTGLLINNILELSDDLEYDGKDSKGALDIRVKIYDDERSAELYFAYGKMYYVKNGARYIFVPKSDEARESFKVLYKSLSFFVQ